MKKIIYWLWIFSLVLLWFGTMCFANDPSFSIKPISGTKIKLYCETPVYLVINWWSEKFNGFEASILFDSNDLNIITWTVNAEFPNGNNFISGNLYNVWWAMAWWYKVWFLTWVSFSIKSKRNILSSALSFVDKNWNTPNYWLETTDDGISLNGYDQWSKDILSGVNNVVYEFQALPCQKDTDKPTITNKSVSNWATKIASNQVITFLTYDWNSNKKVTHWFGGNSTWNLSNYVTAPSNVDNQEWVNSSSISVTVSCPTCSTPKSNIPATLSISDWNWETSINALTWDSERRWYNVSINPPFEYEVEKQVTVNISVTDNPNEDGETHTKTESFSFNAPVAPSISRIYPSTNTFVSPSKNFEIKFYISDDWAWINTWSIIIKIPQIMTWEEVILNEYVYSGSDLNFELSWWSAGLGNSWSYVVSFYPKTDFPVNETITINVTWSDLAWNTKAFTTSFSTRPACSFFGCVDILNIIWNNFVETFSGKILIVTWTNTNSQYPYLTWENNEILMCGKERTWVTLSGSISLYDQAWNKINWLNYTWNVLYITGLDFENIDKTIYIN